ncbi:MAG: hypothetical protein ACXWBP_09185 [Limisphaerales bacterium]
MKKLFLTCITLLLATLPLLAHEGDMDNTQGLFGFPPEYVHVLINPLPTYGLIVGVVVLLVGLLLRSIITRNVGLIIILFCTGIVWAVAHYGQNGYNHLYMDLDAATKKWADIHMDRAESFAWVFYATAALSLIALLVPKVSRSQTVATASTPAPIDAANPPRTETRTITPPAPKKLTTVGNAFSLIVLICAIICFGLGSWISRAGGRIRHPEFREGPAPTNAPAAHEHHHD